MQQKIFYKELIVIGLYYIITISNGSETQWWQHGVMNDEVQPYKETIAKVRVV